MKKTILLFAAVLFCCRLCAQQNCHPQLGATLAPLAWNFNPSNWFVDYMKMSKPGFGPVSGPWDTGMPATDAAGWPTEPFSVWVKLGIYPQDTGIYQLAFEGFAAISTFGQHQVSEQQYNAVLNKTTAKITINPNAPQLALQFNSPMSPVVQHIQLIAPGFDPDNHPDFRPQWVEHVSRFPVLRFMTWNAANFNTNQNWSDRNRTDNPTQSFSGGMNDPNQGVAWEYVAELANLSGADIWINIPVNASDDYVAQLALFLKNNLQPGARIYTEYANEVWNGSFFPYSENMNATIGEINAGNSNLNYDGNTNPDILAVRRYARRTKEIGDIFSQVFGNGALFNRIFPVLGYQVVNPGFHLKEGLEFIKAQYGAPKNYFWGVAGAPFLDDDEVKEPGITRDLYFQKMNQKLNRMFGDTGNFLDEGVVFATFYDLTFMAHEAGTDTYMDASYPAAVRDTIAAAQEDPRMKTLITDYLGNWFRYGGKDGVFTWFLAGATDWRNGDTYGLTDDVTHQNGLKIQAIDQVLSEECPGQQVGHPVPGVIDARQFVYYPETWENTPFNPMMFEGNSHQYLLRATASGTYCMSLVAEKPQFADSRFQIVLDDNIADTLTIQGGQQPGVDTFLIGDIALTEGIHALRLKYLSWCYGTHALIFSSGSCTVSDIEVVVESPEVYPNPATKGVWVNGIPALNGPQLLKIFDMTGRKIIEKTIEIKVNEPVWIAMPLNSGVYMLQMGDSFTKIALR